MEPRRLGYMTVSRYQEACSAGRWSRAFSLSNPAMTWSVIISSSAGRDGVGLHLAGFPSLRLW